jgi:hypothetical protein
MFRVLPRVVVLALAASLCPGCASTHGGGPAAEAIAAAEAGAPVGAANLNSKAKAITVAQREARKRGWPLTQVLSARFEYGVWQVSLQRLPKLRGHNATVAVSLEGEFIGYFPDT